MDMEQDAGRQHYKQVIYDIIGAAMEVHRTLGWGLLEPIYQEALYLELQSKGIDCQREQEIEIRYKQYVLDKKYRADLIVGDVIVELKSVWQILGEHRAQLCNYLRLTKKPYGVLINFGERSLAGERWQYDPLTNECTLVNKDMEPVISDDYRFERYDIQTNKTKEEINE